jgi:hypothetical protein
MNVFLVANYIVYFLYVVAYLGIWRKAPQYLEHLQTLLKLYVGIVLVLTFNPFVPVSMSGMIRQIAFSAGIFVLTGLSLDKIKESLNPNNAIQLLNPILSRLVSINQF